MPRRRATGAVMPDLDAAIYDHLHNLARRIHAERRGGETLSPTALVHEAWEKIASSSSVVTSRAHFMAVAARAMRQILIDRARQLASVKHGGELMQTTFADFGAAPIGPEGLLAMDAALTELREQDAQIADVVAMRAFAGATVPEVAEALGISASSVDRAWRFGRAYLAERLG